MWLEQVDIFTDITAGQIHVRSCVGNAEKRYMDGRLEIYIRPANTEKPIFYRRLAIAVDGHEYQVENTQFAMPGQMKLWDEFDPNLYEMDVSFTVSDSTKTYKDGRKIAFGMRQLTRDGTQFCLNGYKVFLNRGVIYRGFHLALLIMPEEVPSVSSLTLRGMYMFTVLIVEDEVLVSISIKNMIDWAKLDMCVIGEAQNGKDAYELYQREKPNLVITDIKMPVMDGLQLISKIREKDKQTKIIILTCYDEFDLVHKALMLGVSDYILKLRITTKEIEPVLQKVHSEMQSEIDSSI